MRNILFAVVLSMVLTGCATTAKYEAKLNSWVGQNEDSLIAGWGVPEKTYQMQDGKKALEFVHKSVVQMGGYTYTQPQVTYHSGSIGNKQYSGTSTTYVTEVSPVQRYKLSCKTTFILDTDGKVAGWHHEGNDCTSN